LWPDDGVVDGWTVGVALWQAMPFALLLLVFFIDLGARHVVRRSRIEAPRRPMRAVLVE
jgi:hypothetical protein